ncbi:MAG: GGDEF domain-containing protein [Bryobacteraceae bacterium]|nr:GGDEF domain-containing protein [Bryobacteraceae bacterium]
MDQKTLRALLEPALADFIEECRTICCLAANEHGVIAFANTAAAALFGVVESELLGRTLWEFLPHADAAALRSGSRERQGSRRLRLNVVGADHRPITLDCVVRTHGDTVVLVGEPSSLDPAQATQLLQLHHEMEALARQQARPGAHFRPGRSEWHDPAQWDPLTGAANRSRLDSVLHRETEYQRAHGTPLTVVLLDVDHLKAVNDTYGEAAGDAVLVELGRLLHHDTRSHELVARYGGEEFVVVLPGAGLRQGAGLAERLRIKVADMEVEACPVSVTASFGVASMQQGESPESLLGRADVAMQTAKRKGRNRVECALDGDCQPIP